MISDDARGKGCVLKLSWVSILHSITLNFDWVYDMQFVYRGKTKHLWQALTNVLHAAIFKYGSINHVIIIIISPYHHHYHRS